MSVSPPSAGTVSRRPAWLLLAAYPVLLVAGVVTHRQIFPLLALALLLTVWMLPRLRTFRPRPWLAWSAMQAGLLLLLHYRLAGLLLETLPIVAQALLAYGFGRTLAGPEPLVARFIVVLEGEARLQQPGVLRYARQVTWFWTLLLAGQALLLGVLLLCANDSGLLARLGIVSPLHVPEPWATTWLRLGCFAVIGLAFVLEYACRRWRLRHLPHPGLHRMLVQLALHWPELVRGMAARSA
ncbi:MAG: xanthomonadin biosynthesis protein [Xanthomonadaceae bacterium]|nr:xanthomonadin biosynthesis protein [Xanthomonadaceae bacterium]